MYCYESFSDNALSLKSLYFWIQLDYRVKISEILTWDFGIIIAGDVCSGGIAVVVVFAATFVVLVL